MGLRQSFLRTLCDHHACAVDHPRAVVARLLAIGLMVDVQGKTLAAGVMPVMASEDMHLHDSVSYWEGVQAALAHAGLLKSAMGMDPDDALKIVDVNLDELPALPPGDRDYERRLETRSRIKAQNKSNRRQRYAIIMRQRTEVYTSLYQSVEPKAPIFARELREACDYTRDGIAGGYFDGVTAYRMVYDKLFAEKRTQMDVDFYNAAKELQTKTRLPDGCTADAFMAKAVAWIYKIRPHLAQPFSDEDAARYIINLMPKRLGADARRIEQQVEQEGKMSDLMYLSRELRKVVYKDQNPSTVKASALVQVDQELAAGFDLGVLADMTGMALAAATPKTKPVTAPLKLLGGTGGKWCSKCPHPNAMPCFVNPSWEGPFPVWLHMSAERKKPYLKGRQEICQGWRHLRHDRPALRQRH